MDLTFLTPIYRIHEVQRLRTSPSLAWEFVSDPRNLEKITPPEMGFEIVSGADSRIYEGQMIRYNVRPFLGLKIAWISEITCVRPGEAFIDEQRVGPYRLWHHQHSLRPTADGVEMEDIVHYVLPLGPLGALLNSALVSRQLRHIFQFRRQRLSELFPGPKLDP